MWRYPAWEDGVLQRYADSQRMQIWAGTRMRRYSVRSMDIPILYGS